MQGIDSIAVLLPAGRFFDRLFAEAIEPACAEAGIPLTRPDPEFSSGSRLGRACAEIERAGLVLADISGRNPNILYLAGYAHGIGKQVVFLSSHAEDLPFDPARHQIIVHHGSSELLRDELRRLLQEGAAPDEASASGGEVAREKFEAIFGEIMKEHGAVHAGRIEMENESTFLLLNQDLDLPVVQHLARRARELGLRIKLL